MLNTQTLCKDCLGCQKLELINFEGVYRCNNYISAYHNEKNISYTQQMISIINNNK